MARARHLKDDAVIKTQGGLVRVVGRSQLPGYGVLLKRTGWRRDDNGQRMECGRVLANDNRGVFSHPAWVQTTTTTFLPLQDIPFLQLHRVYSESFSFPFPGHERINSLSEVIYLRVELSSFQLHP